MISWSTGSIRSAILRMYLTTRYGILKQGEEDLEMMHGLLHCSVFGAMLEAGPMKGRVCAYCIAAKVIACSVPEHNPHRSRPNCGPLSAPIKLPKGL